MADMTLDKVQGKTEDDRDFGYVCGDGGGYFFTWMPTLEETLDSLDVDQVDGDGGLDADEVREYLSSRIASSF